MQTNMIMIKTELWNKIFSLNYLNDSEWKELESFLNLSQNNFVEKLRQNFPILSQDDIRIIFLLRLGMKNSEIAKKLNILSTSFRMRRYRLKSKMGIKCCSLSEYIKNMYK
ncbi:Uncharacterised protein [Bacteroides heparinolyticus]|uniref:HTH luxR-type domain-containing protein n=2 Tax=Prevotella heparinolytica TaxID=28113 RepID=A0A449I277_9BACE|nr:Uncharacterised protein [Bacteroides heparinolyticus]